MKKLFWMEYSYLAGARPKRVGASFVNRMKNFFRFTAKNVLLAISFAIFPWLPPVLFEKRDFYFHLTHNPDWYYNLSGYRLFVDLASFAVWGIVATYLLRPRWALIQIGLNALLVWVLFYLACPIYGPGGVWQPECYTTGPDGLVGLRLAGIMFCYGALPVIARTASKGDVLDRRIRPVFAVLSGTVLTIVMIWFPLSPWFSGVTYLPPSLIFQTVLLIGVPQIATGILAARIGGSVRIGTASGTLSLLLTSAIFWTPGCPDCDRSSLFLFVPLWAIFALLGSITELGLPPRLQFPRVAGWLGTVVAREFCDPSVLYASSMSTSPGELTLGQPFYPTWGDTTTRPSTEYAASRSVSASPWPIRVF